MRMRKLGALEVSEIGFGILSFTSTYGQSPDKAESIRVIRGAHDLGITLFDTAEAYGPWTNEELLGEALAHIRGEVVIATKFGFDIDPATGERRGLNSQPENIRRAHVVQPVAAVQSEYSLWTRDPEQEVLPLCEELGIGFVPWGPLGTGYLTGKVASSSIGAKDFRAASQRFAPEAMKANQGLIEAIEQLAAAKGATAAQVALAWLIARGPSIVPIFGTRRLDRVKENLGAAEVSLSDEDMAAIEARLAGIEVTGERLPPALLKVTYR